MLDDGSLNPADVNQAVDGSDNEKNTASKIPISKIITQEIAAAADPGYKKLAQQEGTDTQTMMENWDDTMANFVPSDAFNFEIPAGQFEVITCIEYAHENFSIDHLRGYCISSFTHKRDVLYFVFARPRSRFSSNQLLYWCSSACVLDY